MTPLEETIAALTPGQWYQVIRADDDGPLPTCCGNISDLRDQLVEFLRLPTPLGAVEIARALTEDDHGLPSDLDPFRDRLVEYLDHTRPDWRTCHIPDAADLALFEARMTLWGGVGGDHPEWVAAPRPSWQQRLVDAMVFVASIGNVPEDALDQYVAAKGVLAEVFALGAPPAVVMALHATALALYRKSVADQAAAAADELTQVNQEMGLYPGPQLEDGGQ